MYEKNIKNCAYVCPKCFNKPELCTCEMLPETLVQIDKNILPTVQMLNKKWYATEFCCEGHIGTFETVHVAFKHAHKFTLPKGFDGNSEVVMAKITGQSEQAKKRKKRQLLNSLYEWACALEDKKPAVIRQIEA